LEEVVVCRGGEKKETVKLDGIICNLLVKTEVIEVIIFEMKPGASFGEPFQHAGQEAHLVLEGEVEAEIDGKKYLLKRGDVLSFPSVLPHTGRNPGKKKAVLFSIATPPTFM
jgi:mannose-6-phosphate isomerase-like protein (cupin superfamily)